MEGFLNRGWEPILHGLFLLSSDGAKSRSYQVVESSSRDSFFCDLFATIPDGGMAADVPGSVKWQRKRGA